MSGLVILVGAGPGDAGLLTLAGQRALREADLVLYDALVNPVLLEEASPQAELRLVGKRHGRDAVPQSTTEKLMIDAALGGRTVVRLKGGDPFVFGRGGEEAAACVAAGIAFRVVPGVSSAIAAPAYAGIPLTHRDFASQVTVVTGQSGEKRGHVDPDWTALAKSDGTLVFLMAMTRIHEICEKLIDAGLAANTPAAAVRWGTLPRQRTVRGSLGNIAERAQRELVRPPVVLVVGGVAALAESLGWYEKLPLFGRRIVVTRARHQARALSTRLEGAGATVVEYPTIEIQALEPTGVELDATCGADWLVLTSVNGVERFFSAFLASGRDIRELAGVRVAAIGPATEAAIRRRGLHVAARPDEYRAEALLESLGDVAGSRVVLARAQEAREILPEELGRRGANVTVLPLYRTVIPAQVTDPPGEVFPADMVTFTSASTVNNLAEMSRGSLPSVLGDTAVASIGPITTAAAGALGVHVDVEPTDYTIDAMFDAIVQFFANRETLT